MRYILRWASITAALILGILCTLVLGIWRFNRPIRRDVEVLLALATLSRDEALITEEMIRDLPELVRRYLRHTGIVGKPVVDTVYLEQKGQMYLGSKQGWVPLDAEGGGGLRNPRVERLQRLGSWGYRPRARARSATPQRRLLHPRAGR